MARYQRRSTAVPSDGHQDVLLLRLGSRICPSGISAGPALRRRLVGGRDFNARGSPLVHAPHSLRCTIEHVPRWIRHCRLVIHDRRGREIAEERAQAFLAMGFFALTIMRRWRKWARREAGMRGLFVKLSIRDAVRRWKQVARLDAFQATLQRLVMRGALRRWTRELQMRAALAMAVVHYSRRLVSKVWKALVIYQFTSASNRQRLRNALKIWRAWHQWWTPRRRDFLTRMARRALASAVYRWRLGASASRSRRQEAVRLLGSLLLRKCLLALADNSYPARVLRQMLESYHRRTLRDGFEAWGLFLVSRNNDDKTRVVAKNPTRCVTTRRQHRHPGKPRKVHCRCVYAVSGGQRCTCPPRSHLLRRVEELHRLVAKGLNGRDGGHRLLSHFEKGYSGGGTVSLARGSERRGKASCGDLRQGVTAPCVRHARGGKVWDSSSTRCGFHKSPRTGTSKTARTNPLAKEGTDRHRASVAQHTLLVDEPNGIAVSLPVGAAGPRCETQGTQHPHARRGGATSRRHDMTRW